MSDFENYRKMPLHRRTYERYSAEGPATLIQDGRVKRVILSDFSAEGASIITDRFHELNERLDIFIDPQLSLEEPVKRLARVVWHQRLGSDSWKVGLTFGIERLPLRAFIRHTPVSESKTEELNQCVREVKNMINSKTVSASCAVLVAFLISLFFALNGTPQRITLQGITIDPYGNDIALINDRAFIQGDSFANYVIGKISQDRVEFRAGNKVKTVKLNKSIYVLHRQPI